MSEKKITLGEKIRLYRGKHGITQAKFAEMAQVGRESIIKIEQGRNPRSDTEYRIKKILEND